VALYKRKPYILESDLTAFEVRYAPAARVANPGIYRCLGCGEEVAVAKGHQVPRPEQHEHAAGDGKAEWQLIVFAEQKR
jgi:hypothetical protein